MSIPLPPNDPAQILLRDSYTSTPVVYDANCYICRDPEFAQMGLPLCRKCPDCQAAGRGDGHIAADDEVCSMCGYEEDHYEEWLKSEGITHEEAQAK